MARRHDRVRQEEVIMYTDDLEVISSMGLALAIIILFCALL
ncbi:hypothetical protein [Acerihabitans sp.]